MSKVPDDPLLLAMARPAAAAEELPRRLRRTTDRYERSRVLQGWGIALRELGDFRAAVRVLRRAVTEGDRSGDRDRAADARASLGTALAYGGWPARALAAFDAALATRPGQPTRARIEMRRAAILCDLGRPAEALVDYRRCVPALRRDGDPIWLARAVGNEGLAFLQVGDDRRAEDAFREAVRTLGEAGQEVEAALWVHNLALLYLHRGDLPRALAAYTQAEETYVRLGRSPALLVADRCRALLDAAMPAEARADAERFLRGAGARLDLPGAELALLAAEAALASNDPAAAIGWAVRARRASLTRGARRAALTARLVELGARTALGASTRVRKPVERLVTAMAEAGVPEEPRARLLAIRLALDAGDTGAATGHLRALQRATAGATPLRRAQTWLARALIAHATGDGPGVLRAAGRGLAVLDEHRASLGASELRANASRHGAELAGLALDRVADTGSARDLLRWTERWRASVLDLPSAAPPDGDPALLADLAALRQVATRLRGAAGAEEDPRLVRERRRLEERIRRRALGRAAAGGLGTAPGGNALDVARLLDELGDRALVSVVGAGGRTHVVVARRGRVRHVVAGPVAEVRAAAEHVLFALRSVAAGGPAAGYLLPVLEDGLAQLQSLLLGDAVPLLGDDEVVMVPPALLHSLPWDALPALRRRPVSVAPSARTWLRAAGAREPMRRRVTLVGAPGLAHAEAEVAALAGLHQAPTVLVGPAARAEQVLGCLDGVWLGHVAAHGTFRGDNPLLSALEVADGPLTVYDLERLRHPPYRLVLSACESAVGSPTGADELLGVASALLGQGTCGLLASVVPVDDEATARFSVAVHERLTRGDSLAAAVQVARERADGPVDLATAWAFLALGAA